MQGVQKRCRAFRGAAYRSEAMRAGSASFLSVQRRHSPNTSAHSPNTSARSPNTSARSPNTSAHVCTQSKHFCTHRHTVQPQPHQVPPSPGVCCGRSAAAFDGPLIGPKCPRIDGPSPFAPSMSDLQEFFLKVWPFTRPSPHRFLPRCILAALGGVSLWAVVAL
jgi:hypothetical protein